MKYTCIICGYKTLDSRCDWDICPVCFWEDDVLLLEGDGNDSSPANAMTVAEAQANFMVLGAVEKRFIGNVRSAKKDEPVDPSWTPLVEAIAIVEQRK